MLVFLGGVIIVVIFITSVCVNKKLHLENSTSLSKLILIAALCVYLDMGVANNSNHGNLSIGIYLYNSDSMLILIYLLLVLLIVLLAVVITVKLEVGPLLKRL